jgi:hypothetical protein
VTRSRALACWLLLWLLGLMVCAGTLQREAPLFVNLGAGDGPFARGFRAGWERDGLHGSGDTTFHWTEDGARLEVPLVVHAGELRLRLRLARFAGTTARMRLLVAGRVVDEWTQPPSGWKERQVDLGSPRGPLSLQFRSEAPGDDPLGVALDWAEIDGATRVTPRRELWLGLLLFLFGTPLVVGAHLGPRAGLTAGPLAAVLAAIAAGFDRLGGLVAASEAGAPLCVALAALALVHRALARALPSGMSRAAGEVVVPFAAAAIALLALLHPFFYYPDVDTHARFVEALLRDPALALDPSPFQRATGAWTREIAGQRVAFPYSPVFHAVAVPLSFPLGAPAAIKVLAATSLGVTLLAVRALANGAGLVWPWALIAQALLALFPVTTSRLTLALYPTLLGQALELTLAAHLGLILLSGRQATPRATTGALVLAAQVAYTGSLLNVSLLLLGVVATLWWRGDRGPALRLLALHAATAGLVIAILYGRFIPTLFQQVLPHATRLAGDADAGPPGHSWLALALRVYGFYGPLLPALVAVGLVAVRGAREPAWRIVRLLLLSGLLLSLLRSLAPTLFRDAKEIELLAAPVALLAVAGLRALGTRRLGRGASGVVLAGLLVWGSARAVLVYSERFLSVGR